MSVTSKKWLIEVVWWIVTAIISLIIVLPIILAQIQFEWLWFNVIYIFASITLTRYIFTLHYHPFSHSKVFKILVILVIPLLFFPILEGLHSFLEFCDQVGIRTILQHLSMERQSWLSKYIRIEYVFAGITCFIGIFAIIIKMIRSLWRQVKYNQV